jgi:hypothetical protein
VTSDPCHRDCEGVTDCGPSQITGDEGRPPETFHIFCNEEILCFVCFVWTGGAGGGGCGLGDQDPRGPQPAGWVLQAGLQVLFMFYCQNLCFTTQNNR